MDQRKFENWKDYLSTKYKIGKKDNHANPFRIREIHWMNFDWGEDSDEQTVHHPEEVWFRNSFSTNELWKKVRVTTLAQVNLQPSILYERPLPLNPNKMKDLQRMARQYIPEPEWEFYISSKSSAAIEDSDDNE